MKTKSVCRIDDTQTHNQAPSPKRPPNKAKENEARDKGRDSKGDRERIRLTEMKSGV